MTDERFRDHFSTQAGVYAKHRPTYPPALYEHLAKLAPGRTLAWDCATGQGQAALALANHFDRVVATDASEAQLQHAPKHPSVEFRRALAESSGLPDGSVDLIAVAAAIHWFDLDRFYAEVRRVSRPGAVLAAWSYGAAVDVSDDIDPVVRRFADETLGPYWPPEFAHVRTRYENLLFPFPRLPAPGPMAATTEGDLEAFLGNVRSWSGLNRYVEATGRDPVPELEAELRPLWGEGARMIAWPLHFLLGRVGQ